MNWEDPPEWEDMPKRKPLLHAYWEDVYNAALPIYAEKHNRKPTREETIAIFDMVFDDEIEIYLDRYHEHLESVVNETV